MKRRNFLKLSATASVMGLTPLQVQATLKPLFDTIDCPNVSNRKLVLINLAGGNDGLNTIIPLNQYNIYSKLRPTIKVPNSGTNGYIKLDQNLPNEQQIGLNPALKGFKALYDKGWLRVLQSVGYPSQNKSHFKSTDLYLTGNDGNGMQNGVDSGWMGRFIEKYYDKKIGESFPLAVEIGSNKTSLGFHGEEEHGLSINLTGQDPAGFYSVLSGLGGVPPVNIPQSEYGKEIEFITSIDSLSNIYAESISSSFNNGRNTITYPDTDIANQLKTVSKLISGDLETKVYMVRISGFDTHNAQVQGIGSPEGNHHKLLTNLSEAIETFFIDLDNQNLSDDVVGLTFSEFGRKAAENGNFGTDHGEIAPMIVVGKPIEGGVTGNNPDLSEAKSENNFQIKTVQFDYRQTISTLLQDFTGVSDSVIDSTFFNYSLNNSFNDLKIEKLIKPSFVIKESCLVDSYGDVGIDIPDVTEFESLVYPNPFTSFLTINSIEQQENIAFKLYNINGKLILNDVKSTEYGKLKLNLSFLPKGAYLIQININGKWETQKILKY